MVKNSNSNSVPSTKNVKMAGDFMVLRYVNNVEKQIALKTYFKKGRHRNGVNNYIECAVNTEIDHLSIK